MVWLCRVAVGRPGGAEAAVAAQPEELRPDKGEQQGGQAGEEEVPDENEAVAETVDGPAAAPAGCDEKERVDQRVGAAELPVAPAGEEHGKHGDDGQALHRVDDDDGHADVVKGVIVGDVVVSVNVEENDQHAAQGEDAQRVELVHEVAREKHDHAGDQRPGGHDLAELSGGQPQFLGGEERVEESAAHRGRLGQRGAEEEQDVEAVSEAFPGVGGEGVPGLGQHAAFVPGDFFRRGIAALLDEEAHAEEDDEVDRADDGVDPPCVVPDHAHEELVEEPTAGQRDDLHERHEAPHEVMGDDVGEEVAIDRAHDQAEELEEDREKADEQHGGEGPAVLQPRETRTEEGEDFRTPSEEEEEKGDERRGEEEKGDAPAEPAAEFVAPRAEHGVHHHVHRRRDAADDQPDELVGRPHFLEGQGQHGGDQRVSQRVVAHAPEQHPGGHPEQPA